MAMCTNFLKKMELYILTVTTFKNITNKMEICVICGNVASDSLVCQETEEVWLQEPILM